MTAYGSGPDDYQPGSCLVTLITALTVFMLLIALGLFVNAWITKRPPPMP